MWDTEAQFVLVNFTTKKVSAVYKLMPEAFFTCCSHYSGNEACSDRESGSKVEKKRKLLQREKSDAHHHGHPDRFCCHVDAVQRDGAHHHVLLHLHPQLAVDHRLLAVLHQQHRQPSLLRPLQHHLQEYLQAPASVPVQEHPWAMREQMMELKLCLMKENHPN